VLRSPSPLSSPQGEGRVRVNASDVRKELINASSS